MATKKEIEKQEKLESAINYVVEELEVMPMCDKMGRAHGIALKLQELIKQK